LHLWIPSTPVPKPKIQPSILIEVVVICWQFWCPCDFGYFLLSITCERFFPHWPHKIHSYVFLISLSPVLPGPTSADKSSVSFSSFISTAFRLRQLPPTFWCLLMFTIYTQRA
jgi:hypothetical protein